MNDRWPPKALRGANPRPREPEVTTTPLPENTGYTHRSGTVISNNKEPPFRSRSYLDFIRARPCHHCAEPAPSEAAHFAPRGDGGGMGMKADDRRCVPQCHRCHSYWHQHGVLPSVPVNTNLAAFGDPWNREQSERFMLREQVRCLLAWDTLRSSF